MNGFNFAVDGNSGSIHMLDNVACDVLKHMPEFQSRDKFMNNYNSDYTVEEVKEAYNEISDLKEQGVLFSPEIDGDLIMKQIYNDNSLKALCLHIAHDCNLRCEYCFASKGDYKRGRQLMPEDVALKAVDYLVENSGSKKNIEIDFFGGEPLLNFEVVQDVVEYGRRVEKQTGKKFYFTITTNGTLLNDEIIDFINVNMDNVVISIDGRKKIHDSIRYDTKGKGSYDRILPSALKLVRKRGNKSYFIRGTYTSRNLDFSNDVMHLADLGFREISIEPVVGSGKDMFIKEENIPQVMNEYETLLKKYLERVREGKYFRFYHFNMDLYGGPCIFKRISACGAGFSYLAVSPEGYLYPCHQFVGQEQFIMGDIHGGINNEVLRKRFKGNNVLKKGICSKCWAKLFCSGGCHAGAYFTNGDIEIPNELECIMQKKRIECAIMVQTILRSGNDMKTEQVL